MDVDKTGPPAEDVNVDGGYPEKVKTEYKSYKKKYRKMRLLFEQKMNQSNALYKKEQEAAETAQRLALENDQILDVLLDLNNSTQIPDKQRIDLSDETPSLDELPPLIDSDPASSDSSPARSEYLKIRQILEDRINAALSSKPSKSLSSLVSSTPHRAFTVSSSSADLSALPGVTPELAQDLTFPSSSSTLQPEPVSYLSPDRLDENLALIDTSLNQSPGPILQNSTYEPTTQLGTHLSDKELAVRNPMSVYNWLRVHEPKIFLQDGESQVLTEKSTKPGALRGAGKRHSIPAPSKPDVVEFVEEDGLGYDTGLAGSGYGGGREGGRESKGGKRKRISVDDAGYNPKGGGTRPYKKKKKDSDIGGGSRRSSTAKGKGKGAAERAAAAAADDSSMVEADVDESFGGDGE